MKKRLVILFLITFALLLSLYVPIYSLPLNKVLISIIEKRLDARIRCSSLKIYLWRSLIAEGITAVGKGGFALSADNVKVDCDPISIFTGRLRLTFNLENVKFYKSGMIMDSLSDMLHIQPLGNLTFKTVQGKFYVGRYDTLTHDLILLSDRVKIFANAVTDREDEIMCLLYFFLNDELVSEIPEDIRNSLLHKEDGPWSSVYIGIMGNYRSPRLRIITERFRVNIASKPSPS